MYPIPEVDAVVLLAISMASKRRPAALVDVVAAAALLQGFVIYPDKLGDAIARLSDKDLVQNSDEGLSLTEPAQQMMAGLPRKGEKEDHLAYLLGQLKIHRPQRQYPVIDFSMEALVAAVLEYKEAAKTPGQNLLKPKPKADRYFKKDGRWHCAPGNRQRKEK